MNKRLISVGLFLLAFAGTYLALSFAVPEFAKPEITDVNRFFAESLLHLIGVKTLISLMIAVFLSRAPWIRQQNKENQPGKKAGGKKKG